MITAHLPSGYLLARVLPHRRAVLAAAMIGAVLPDLDLIWFYFIDHRAFHHHRYWVHIPAFWAMLAVFALPLIRWIAPRWGVPALAFLAGIFLHIGLDTIAGDILWGWPFSDRFTHLVDIPATYADWKLNFILHWVFLAEIAIWLAAATLLIRSRRRDKGTSPA